MKTKTEAEKPIGSAAQFFYEHAGYSYDPKTETPEQGRRRCAIGLAASEANAKDEGYRFKWSKDGLTNRKWTDEGPKYGTWGCVCRNQQGKIIGSLCGIDLGQHGRPSLDPYARVVQAEICIDGLTEAQEAHRCACADISTL